VIVLSGGFECDLVTSRQLNKIKRFANRLVMLEQKATLPEHFELNKKTRPGGLWNYEKRDKEYQKSKARRKRHQKPNVLSGDLRDKVVRSAKVTATAKRGTLSASGTHATNLRGPRREEIMAMHTNEQADMLDRWLDTVTKLVADPKNRRKVRKRNSAGQFK
tara:strand:- start:257 stop:742 length:486 start_codon:yes stop_codon:yes gene_type:complete